MSWDNIIFTMWKKGFWSKEKPVHLFHVSNLESTEAGFDRSFNILPAAYKKADLPSHMPRHLAPEEQEDLLGLLETFEELIEGCLGLMTGEPYSLKLKPNAETVNARPFPVLQKHVKLMKDEVN